MDKVYELLGFAFSSISTPYTPSFRSLHYTFPRGKCCLRQVLGCLSSGRPSWGGLDIVMNMNANQKLYVVFNKISDIQFPKKYMEASCWGESLLIREAEKAPCRLSSIVFIPKGKGGSPFPYCLKPLQNDCSSCFLPVPFLSILSYSYFLVFYCVHSLSTGCLLYILTCGWFYLILFITNTNGPLSGLSWLHAPVQVDSGVLNYLNSQVFEPPSNLLGLLSGGMVHLPQVFSLLLTVDMLL